MANTNYKLILVLLSFFICSNSYAGNGLLGKKDRNEGVLTFGIGPAYLFGDVGGTTWQPLIGIEDLKIEYVNYLLSLEFRHYLLRNFGYRLAVQYTNLSGSDEGSRLAYRGYIFESTVIQASLQLEYVFLNRENYWLYTFSGGGIAHSSSRLTGAPIRSNDSWKPQETAPYVVIGAGIETRLSQRATLGLEINTNYYFSNYMEGIRTLHTANNDVISGIMLTFSYSIFGSGRINRNSCPCHWDK